ncbi:MAG: tRNA (N6-isopentenyl adenosine(37)-C2)-methylthiotransferase MiaB [Caulobacterales bacterium]|jgi:tRNA-2-methylthio-N6-dimethylallyladenosine synthase
MTVGETRALKRLYIETYGCQMNVYDSERMKDVLAPLGYTPTADQAEADMVILNTCHIREKATEKVYSELGRIRVHKDRRSGEGLSTTVIVAGCVAQAEGEEIIARAPVVDLVVGPQAYHRIPELIAKATRAKGEKLAADFTAEEKFDQLPLPQANGVTAFLSVQEGCDKFCTFCVVPYTRGSEFSRPVEAIAAEARSLVQQGVREITLLGQNVNAFHGVGADGSTWNLARLLVHLAKIAGLERLRYMTSHPNEMTDDLIAAHGHESKIMPFLHLPIQSGSDRILRAMNRKHSATEYLTIIEKIRSARPDIAISSDFIVGFPGERDQDFEETMALIEAVGFSSAYSFKYSRRPGTPASEMMAQIPEDVKDARLQALQALLRSQQGQFNQAQVGKTLPVLVERVGRRPGQVGGRSPYLQSVHFEGPDTLVGQIAHVSISASTINSLTGTMARSAAA